MLSSLPYQIASCFRAVPIKPEPSVATPVLWSIPAGLASIYLTTVEFHRLPTVPRGILR